MVEIIGLVTMGVLVWLIGKVEDRVIA